MTWTSLGRSSTKKKTFLQRLGNTALVFGLPLICLELVTTPIQGWGWLLLLELPATIVGVFFYAVIEYGVVREIERHGPKATG